MTQPKMEGIANRLILKTMRLSAYLFQNFVIVFHHLFIGCFGFLVITVRYFINCLVCGCQVFLSVPQGWIG